MQTRTYFLKNEEVYKNMQTILNDEKFSISKYGIKPSYILDKLEKKSKIQFKSAEKIKNIYNGYFKKNLTFEEIFNTSMIITYVFEYKINFFYVENDSYTLMNGIKVIMGSNKNGGDNFYKNLKIINIPKIIFYLVLIILIGFYIYYILTA